MLTLAPTLMLTLAPTLMLTDSECCCQPWYPCKALALIYTVTRGSISVYHCTDFFFMYSCRPPSPTVPMTELTLASLRRAIALA